MTDFKQALAALDAEIEKAIGAGFSMHDDHYAQTIRKALQIADALMGEPTEEMVEAAAKALWDSSPSDCDMSWEECVSIMPAEANKVRELAITMLTVAIKETV